MDFASCFSWPKIGHHLLVVSAIALGAAFGDLSVNRRTAMALDNDGKQVRPSTVPVKDPDYGYYCIPTGQGEDCDKGCSGSVTEESCEYTGDFTKGCENTTLPCGSQPDGTGCSAGDACTVSS